jgi:hypothetical protein
MAEDILAAGRNPNGTYDGRKVLSALTGGRVSPQEIQSAFEAVKANKAAWANCPAPHHVVDRIGKGFPMKFRCRHCSATCGSEIVHYIQGYEARGGVGRDIWSEWDR